MGDSELGLQIWETEDLLILQIGIIANNELLLARTAMTGFAVTTLIEATSGRGPLEQLGFELGAGPEVRGGLLPVLGHLLRALRRLPGGPLADHAADHADQVRQVSARPTRTCVRHTRAHTPPLPFGFAHCL